MHDFVILVPAFTQDGPVKGAIALANELSKSNSVRLVSLKGVFLPKDSIEPKVQITMLGRVRGSYLAKRRYLLNLIGRDAILLSSCFSADLFTFGLRKFGYIASSVRANNYKNYKYTYGFVGLVLAWFHYKILSRFDAVFAMDTFMAETIKVSTGKDPVIVGNFIDETVAEEWRVSFGLSDVIRLCFVGHLTERKQPHVLLDAISTLVKRDINVSCKFIGDGPLSESLKRKVIDLGLSKNVELLGFVSNPFLMVSSSDILVLPSLSEGTPRAALEALYLGVPCVLRDVDGNSCLITGGLNGELFYEDSELPEAITRCYSLVRRLSVSTKIKPNLLPTGNMRDVAIKNLLGVFSKNSGI